MLERREEPNFIINSRPLNQYSALIEKIICPICCVVFLKKHAPMISCPSAHTICASCLEAIVKKTLQTPGNHPSCPLCRQRIELPLQQSEEYIQLMKFLQSIEDILLSMGRQTDQLKQKSTRIAALENEIKRKNQEIFDWIVKTRKLEQERNKFRQQNNNLLQKIKVLEQNAKKRHISNTDAEGEEKVQKKQNIVQENQNRIPNKEIEIDSRPPLRQLYYNDQVDEQNRLILTRKNYNLVQMEFLVFHDLSPLIEVNLSCNQIGNIGFHLLMEKSNFANLNSLNVSNNQITELPSNMDVLTKLVCFNIGNLRGEDRRTCNRLKESEFEKMLAHKWELLKTLDVEIDTDLVWDNEENIDKLVVQWPAIGIISICTFTMKMTKKKCQQLTKTLNFKAKRPGSINRILAVIKSNN